VAGIDIAWNYLLQNKRGLLNWRKAGQATFSAALRAKKLFYTPQVGKENLPKAALIVIGTTFVATWIGPILLRRGLELP